ncbi:hypothetical protein BD626DRAFT_548763 [Schizophyllum amplum]|uniref:Mediator of RNA polymerase II transcription subunit 9 n=1 Tax=Schizophyllum amplum TaxID=97359 RepID=A0A550CCB7_9AGAR|nr:hypothetical protein BD626DRAFT_548763 [Auriculariopsis ampla]
MSDSKLSSVPASLHEGLMPKLADAILQATNDFKRTLAQAREFAMTLPGGELVVEDQDQVLQMLTRLRDKKKEQLTQFSAQALPKRRMSMDMDSAASTPAD